MKNRMEIARKRNDMIAVAEASYQRNELTLGQLDDIVESVKKWYYKQIKKQEVQS